MPRLEQPTQVKSTQVYDDTLAQGPGLQPAPGVSNLQADLNSIRAQLRRIIDAVGAGKKWYDPNVINSLTAAVDPWGLQQIHDKMFVDGMPPVFGTTEFALAVTAIGVLLDSAKFPGGVTKVAVGAASGQDLGLVVASQPGFTVPGTLSAGLSLITDADGIVLNRINLIDTATNAAPSGPSDETVFGLMQVLSGTVDGALIAGAGVENVQMTFAFYAFGTGVLTAFSLPPSIYSFAPNRAHYFYSLPRGAMIGGGPAIAAAGGGGSKAFSWFMG